MINNPESFPTQNKFISIPYSNRFMRYRSRSPSSTHSQRSLSPGVRINNVVNMSPWWQSGDAWL